MPKSVFCSDTMMPTKKLRLVQGKKWVVEYVEGNPNLEIQTTETNQSVYIYRCVGSTIHIQERGAWRRETVREKKPQNKQTIPHKDDFAIIRLLFCP
jgi:hypothetical protein